MLLPGLIDDVATGTIFVQCVLALVLAADLMMWRSTAGFRLFSSFLLFSCWMLRRYL